MTELGIILLYVFGMALAVVEIFVPGAIMGLVGLACILASVYLAFREGGPLGWVLIGVTLASIPAFVALWVKVINRVLAMKATQAGYTSAQVHLKELLGHEGVALTHLRPVGVARFGDKKVDVVSEGEMIESGSRVCIVEVQSNRVMVRAVRR